jgi:hypothetical protein
MEKTKKHLTRRDPFGPALCQIAVAITFLGSLRAGDELDRNGNMLWHGGIYSRVGVVTSWTDKATSSPGVIDVAQYFGLEMAPMQRTEIAAFSIEYSESQVWVCYLDKSRSSLGFSRRFERLPSSDGDRSELVWTDTRKGPSQGGYATEQCTYLIRTGANKSLEMETKMALSQRHFLGLWTENRTSESIVQFEEAGPTE